jgi:hypothetical protein
MSFSDSIVAYAQNARNFEFIFILKAKWAWFRSLWNFQIWC